VYAANETARVQRHVHRLRIGFHHLARRHAPPVDDDALDLRDARLGEAAERLLREAGLDLLRQRREIAAAPRRRHSAAALEFRGPVSCLRLPVLL